MKIIGSITIFLLGLLLITGAFNFSNWGDPESPASLHVSPYYIQHTIEDSGVPNIVTSVLADYRGYDTMFETTVILTAGIACFLLLRTFGTKKKSKYYRHIPTGITIKAHNDVIIPTNSNVFRRIDSIWVPYNIILKTGCRFIIPFIQLFALYVVAHGHHSPGGGFQGGVIYGAAIILFAMSLNLRATINRF